LVFDQFASNSKNPKNFPILWMIAGIFSVFLTNDLKVLEIIGQTNYDFCGSDLIF